MKPKEVYNPLFDYYMAIFKGSSLKEAKEFAEKRLDITFTLPPSIQACVFRTSDCYNQVVWFKDKKPKNEVIAHEAFHVVYHGLEMKRIPLNEHTEEVYAYLLEWTIKQIKDAK